MPATLVTEVIPNVAQRRVVALDLRAYLGTLSFNLASFTCARFSLRRIVGKMSVGVSRCGDALKDRARQMWPWGVVLVMGKGGPGRRCPESQQLREWLAESESLRVPHASTVAETSRTLRDNHVSRHFFHLAVLFDSRQLLQSGVGSVQCFIVRGTCSDRICSDNHLG